MRVPPDQSSTAAADLVQRHVDVLVAQLAGDVGEAGAEQEGVDAVAVVGDRMQEVQEHARVALHRARRCRTARPAAAAARRGWRKRRVITSPPARAVARRVARRSACVPAAWASKRRVRYSPIGRRSRASMRLAAAISAADICSKSLACSTSRSENVIAASMRSSSVVGRAGTRAAAAACSASASRRLTSGRAWSVSRLGLRQQQRHHPLGHLRVAPEHAEGLVEQLALVVPVHEHRVQGPVEIRLAGEADRLHGADGFEHAARADRQAGRAQDAREVHDVRQQRAVAIVSPRRS